MLACNYAALYTDVCADTYPPMATPIVPPALQPPRAYPRYTSFPETQAALSLATQGMEKVDSQGTLTLWFHENKDKNGDPSNNVYSVSNCHVLRKNTTTDYEHKGGAQRDFVRVCGVRRFQRGLDEINKAISDHSIRASYFTQEIDGLEETDETDEEVAAEIAANRRNLDDENAAIRQLETSSRCRARRCITGQEPFLATEVKVRDQFEGNVVDIGSKYTPDELMALFYPRGGGATTFKLPRGRKLRIVGCTTKEDLDNPTELDSEGEPCIIVGKDDNTTDFTVGCYAGVISFTLNDTGVWSKELGIYNSSLKKAEDFSAKGDSGSLVWRTKDGKGYIVGQLHSGENKGSSTSSMVAGRPGWYLLEQIKKWFPNADFYRTA
ncbi:hypothetical protein BGY98DRAFT_1094158 [Russula aff. rugulosa BPL654]|nr:hypothetical protein BGY98DRAFT_1094158 [Russula aff. rugulosa BPL654]